MLAWRRADVANRNRLGRETWRALGRLGSDELVAPGGVPYAVGDRVVLIDGHHHCVGERTPRQPPAEPARMPPRRPHPAGQLLHPANVFRCRRPHDHCRSLTCGVDDPPLRFGATFGRDLRAAEPATIAVDMSRSGWLKPLAGRHCRGRTGQKVARVLSSPTGSGCPVAGATAIMRDRQDTKMIVGHQIGEVIGELGDWRPSDLDVSGETADRCAGARPVRKPGDRCLNSVDERGAEARSLSAIPSCRVLEL